MTPQFYTYLHCRPDLTPFYVGKGTGYRSHDFSRRNVYHKRVVAKYGRENIQIIVTKKDSEESAFKSEIRLIKILRDAGFDLCNYTNGGEGACGAVRSEETRAEISARMIGNTRGAACKGRKLSAEHCAKLSVAHRGKKLSEKHRANAAAACVGMTGKKHSLETRAKISATKTGKKLLVETRAKISAAMTGRKLSIEHREKLSAAAKVREARKKL